MPINDFSFTMLKQQNLRLTIEIYLLKNKWPLVRSQEQLAPNNHMFCLGPQGLSADTSSDSHAQTSSQALDQVKMLGTDAAGKSPCSLGFAR